MMQDEITTTAKMITDDIEAKKKRGVLTEEYIMKTKVRMDVFLKANRITQQEYNMLLSMMI